MQRHLVFKGEPLPALPPPSWVSPLAPRRAQEAPAGVEPRPRSPPRASRAPSAGLGFARLGAPDGGRGVGVLGGWLPRESATPVLPRPPGFAAGLAAWRKRARRTVAGGRAASVCRGCAREWVRACARVRCLCARQGRRWRPLRLGSAPAGEGLQGLAPPELGICRRSLSIFVES